MPRVSYTITANTEAGSFIREGIWQEAWQEQEAGAFRALTVRVVEELPEGHLEAVTAELPLPLEEGELIFMNGYQSATYSPEWHALSRIPGADRLPSPIAKRLGKSSAGDYHFTEYPNKKGITQGVSYCYFRKGDRFRLVASLNEEPGYTRFSYHAAAHRLIISRDCAGLKVDGAYEALSLFFAVGTEDEVFDAWFERLGIKPQARPRLSGYDSWNSHYEEIDEKKMLKDLAGAAEVLKPGDLFLIDDGWAPAAGDWLFPDEKKFPCGMKAMADAIHERGFKAGLWLAPFAVCKRSALYKEHPKWMLYHGQEPWYGGDNWGGFYSLDFDEPGAREYLKRVFERVIREWGFDVIKLDFLFAAAPYGSARESRAARMIRAMRFLRELCGDRIMIAGAVPLMPAFGIADYCRVSGDVSVDWDDSPWMRYTARERISTKHAVENMIFRRQLDGRAFGNAADSFFLRDKGLKLDSRQKKILAFGAALFGSLRLCSDDMGEYSDAKRESWDKLRHIAEKASPARVEHEFSPKGKEKLTVTYCLEGKEYHYAIYE